METIQKQLNELKELLLKQNIQQKEILTLNEVAEYLQLSKSCLYKMTSSKEIPFYSPGGKKIYFHKKEIDDWVINSRVVPLSEIDEEIENYLSRTNKI